MSQNLNVTLSTKRIRVSAAIVAGLFSATLQTFAADGTLGAPVEQTSDTPSLVFAGVADDTYQLACVRKDATGAPIGDSFTQIITIANQVLTVEQLIDGVSGVALDLVQVPDAVAATTA